MSETNRSEPAAPAVGSQVDRGVRPLAWMPVLGLPLAIRAEILDRQQAEKNHAQTLERIAERGGLSLDEAAALAERRRWRAMTIDEALRSLKKAAMQRPNVRGNAETHDGR